MASHRRQLVYGEMRRTDAFNKVTVQQKMGDETTAATLKTAHSTTLDEERLHVPLWAALCGRTVHVCLDFVKGGSASRSLLLYHHALISAAQRLLFFCFFPFHTNGNLFLPHSEIDALWYCVSQSLFCLRDPWSAPGAAPGSL